MVEIFRYVVKMANDVDDHNFVHFVKFQWWWYIRADLGGVILDFIST